MASWTIFCDTDFPAAAHARLTRGLTPHRLRWARERIRSNLVASPRDPTLAQADVAFGQPPIDGVLEAPSLSFVQLTSAGYGRYDSPAMREAASTRGLAICTSSSVYALPCAEHLLAMMLAAARRLPDCLADQRARAWPDAERRRQSFLLRGQRVVLLGFGTIAQRLVELLAPFEVEIVALRRSPAADDPVRTVAESQLDDELRQADHVVNVLPGTDETEGFVNAARLAAMPAHAHLYNVGRGTTVEQEALVDALRSDAIAGAFLDVTEPEPLPPEHPLWSTPRCYLTPHSAGGRDTEHLALVDHFLTNLERLERGEALVDRVL